MTRSTLVTGQPVSTRTLRMIIRQIRKTGTSSDTDRAIGCGDRMGISIVLNDFHKNAATLLRAVLANKTFEGIVRRAIGPAGHPLCNLLQAF